jgi:hypothetical protein
MDNIPIGNPTSEGIIGTNDKQDITVKSCMHVHPVAWDPPPCPHSLQQPNSLASRSWLCTDLRLNPNRGSGSSIRHAGIRGGPHLRD